MRMCCHLIWACFAAMKLVMDLAMDVIIRLRLQLRRDKAADGQAGANTAQIS